MIFIDNSLSTILLFEKDKALDFRLCIRQCKAEGHNTNSCSKCLFKTSHTFPLPCSFVRDTIYWASGSHSFKTSSLLPLVLLGDITRILLILSLFFQNIKSHIKSFILHEDF